MKKRDIISIIVLAVCVAVWFGGLSVAERWLERKVQRATDGKWELDIGAIRLNPFIPVVTFDNIAARQTANDKTLSAEELRIERPRMGKRGIRARRIVLNRRDTVERPAFVQGRLTVARARFMSEDGSVRYMVDSLAVDTVARRISLKTFAIEPTYAKEEFTEKSWRHGDWTQITIGAVECSGFDMKGMALDSIRIAGGSIVSFKDRKTAHLNTSVKPMYHTVIKRINSQVAIRTVVFEKLGVRYEEVPLRGDEAGVLTVEDISGSATVNDNGTAWSATGLIMGSGPLTARGTLPLKGDQFELSGTLSECRAEIFNPMATPLSNIEIRTGHIRRLDLSIAGDSIQAHARAILIYDGLTVELLDRHHDDRKLISDIINNILPNASETTTPLSGDFARDPQRSVWNYIWKTLFDAIKKAVMGG